MTIFRRRTLFWLIKAYLKKWGKVIGSSFLLGLLIFFLLLTSSQYLIKKIPTDKKVVVGMIGAYKSDNLPPQIVRKLSRGLTSLNPDGTIKPEAAASWEITDLGQTYIFHLRDSVRFSNGKKMTADMVRYDFADVTVEKPDKQTIIYKLKDPYSPFLITVSRPLFIDGLTGIGDYQIINLKVNGGLVESLELRSVKDALQTETYKFYPTEEALKQAFALGEINRAVGLTDTSFKNTTFAAFPKVSISRQIDYTKLVTLFYNTQDSVLSDEKLRNGLSYALPSTFSKGQRNYVAYPPTSEYFNQEELERPQDFPHAKLLIDSALESASQSALPKLRLKVLSRYLKVAEEITAAWKQAGIEVEVEEVDVIPTAFQMYLGDFNMPRDPDQYTLWHSSQPATTNITNYKNLRIDKLLEDGRKTTDTQERKEIYADFQRYLLEDSPASFLYFPYSYTIERE
jgi:ABC-type transport system substrate-binding protein